MPKSTFISHCRLLNRRTLVGTTVLLLSFSQLGYAASQAAKLKVTGGETVSYFCDNGKKMAARYYNLSDNSLSFVKLTLNGKIYTLPQLVSASGARYTDERQVEWWVKGDKALLDEDVADDKSKLVECAEATAKKAEVTEKALPEAKTAVPVKKTEAATLGQASKTEVAEKAKAETKQADAEHAKTDVKETTAKQVKKTEAPVSAKKDVSTAKEK